MQSDSETGFWVEGHTPPARQADLPLTLEYFVEPEYLKVMRIPLLRGRFIADTDNEHSARVVVIDRSFAQKYFPDQDPVGKHVNIPDYYTDASHRSFVPLLVVGVVGHVNQWGLDSDGAEALHAQVYLPVAQIPDKDLQRGGLGADVFLRRQSAGGSNLATLRSRLLEFNSELVVHDPEEMERTVADSIAGKRFTMTLLGVFAMMALLLASIGIYGVLSYMVGQRTREIGVRLALGAQRLDVLRMVLKDGARMTLIGIVLGLLGALGLTRLMASMLFGIRPTDPLTFGAVAVLLSAIALLACYLPARRAMKVDPIEALRHE